MDYTGHMTKGRRKAIADFADSVRKVYGLDTFPVDLKSLVKKLNGKIEPLSYEESRFASGKVKKTGRNSFEIYVKEMDAPRRQYFTTAHEIGHLFIHMGFLINKETWDRIDEDFMDSPYYRANVSEEEYDANEFAGCLLMPEKEFNEYVQKVAEGNKVSVRRVADHFGVSEDAVRTRGKWLGTFSWT